MKHRLGSWDSQLEKINHESTKEQKRERQKKISCF